jgi:hypothetical protein
MRCSFMFQSTENKWGSSEYSDEDLANITNWKVLV